MPSSLASTTSGRSLAVRLALSLLPPVPLVPRPRARGTLRVPIGLPPPLPSRLATRAGLASRPVRRPSLRPTGRCGEYAPYHTQLLASSRYHHKRSFSEESTDHPQIRKIDSLLPCRLDFADSSAHEGKIPGSALRGAWGKPCAGFSERVDVTVAWV